jgi:hypothetical protein
MSGLDEERGQKPLADQATLHVGGAGQNRVDGSVGNRFLQLIESEVSAHSFPAPAPSRRIEFQHESRPLERPAYCFIQNAS